MREGKLAHRGCANVAVGMKTLSPQMFSNLGFFLLATLPVYRNGECSLDDKIIINSFLKTKAFCRIVRNAPLAAIIIYILQHVYVHTINV